MRKDLARLAVQNLRKRLLRTMLTLLGVFIGIAAVVALISLGKGMQDAINDQFASVGADKIIVQGTSAGFGPPGQNVAGSITTRDVELIRVVSGVDRVAGRLLKQVRAEYAGDLELTFLVSLPQRADDRSLVYDAINLRAEKGRLLKPDEQGKVLVGKKFWTGFQFNKHLELGDKIAIQGKQFEMVGFLDSMSGGRDEVFLMNEDDVQDLFGVKEDLSVIVAQVVASEKPSSVAERVLHTLRRDRHQKQGFEDVTVTTSEELIKSINTILNVVQAVVIGIAAISLIVGAIMIMNTMYTSVLERTREIGVMKAIGATNQQVLFVFLVESGVLGGLGGLVGLMLGFMMSTLVSLISSGFLASIVQPSYSPVLIVGALLFSCVIGVLAGVFPALQASRMSPAEAVRA